MEIYLKKNNVPTRRLFFPLNKQPCFKNNNHVINLHQSFPGTESAYNTILSLPSSILLDIEQKEKKLNDNWGLIIRNDILKKQSINTICKDIK